MYDKFDKDTKKISGERTVIKNCAKTIVHPHAKKKKVRKKRKKKRKNLLHTSYHIQKLSQIDCILKYKTKSYITSRRNHREKIFVTLCLADNS